jgi:hypothetical protein
VAILVRQSEENVNDGGRQRFRHLRP